MISLPLIGVLSIHAVCIHADDPEKGPKPMTSRSVAVTRSPEKPEYARSLGAVAEAYGLDWVKRGVDWLDFGIESRTRYERRWQDYTTREIITDDALVTRNLLYLGVKNVLDPLRFVVELEDSRRFLSDRPDIPNVVNKLELLQAYGQLYFDDVFGGAPMRVNFGRMCFDSGDRRLIERTRNRNAMTAFDGVRLRLGDEQGPWEADAFALRHVERDVEDFDKSSPDSALYGITGYLRGSSPMVVLEPSWLWLDQRQERDIARRRNLHTFGLHAFGQWGERAAWDYDVSLSGQLGEARGLSHRAGAAHLEVGHTWSTAGKPRVALWFNYATGDRDPNDVSSERFDSLFGDNFSFYSYGGYFTWQNIINPALRLSFQPASHVRCEVIHRAIWLASDTDSWVRAERRDPAGGSGSFVGQETDARIIWQVCPAVEIDIAFAHFFPGSFTERTGNAPESDFVQITATVRF